MSEEQENVYGGSRRRRQKIAQANLQTGGPLDAIGGVIGGGIDAVTGAGDFLLGDIDEAAARQFDDEPGGGFIDGFRETVPFLEQPESVTERQVEEGILPEDALDNQKQSASDASLKDTQAAGPPGGTAVHVVRIQNGLLLVRENDIDSRDPDKDAAFDPAGAMVGIGAGAAAGIATGAATGSIAGPPGTILGAVGGAAGSLLRPTISNVTGALGYTITAAIDGEVVGQTVTSVDTAPGALRSTKKDVRIEHRLPEQEGTYDVDIVVSLWQSGKVVKKMTTQMEVRESARSNSVDDNDDNGDKNGGGFNFINFARNNPGIAALSVGGGLVALNAFAGGYGESFGSDTTIIPRAAPPDGNGGSN